MVSTGWLAVCLFTVNDVIFRTDHDAEQRRVAAASDDVSY